MAKILCVGDLHFPFAHKKAIDQMFALTDGLDISHVVQLGDLYDFYSPSRFPKKLFITPEDELIQAREGGIEFWKRVQKQFPKAKCHQILGNHCIRPVKLAKETAPSLIPFVQDGMKALFKFDDVTTHFDTRVELEIEGILFTHGHLSGIGKHLGYYKRNIVHGHSHKGNVYFESHYQGHNIWELDCGFLGNPFHEVFAYSPTRYHKMTLGFGLVLDGFPQFVHYVQQD